MGKDIINSEEDDRLLSEDVEGFLSFLLDLRVDANNDIMISKVAYNFKKLPRTERRKTQKKDYNAIIESLNSFVDNVEEIILSVINEDIVLDYRYYPSLLYLSTLYTNDIGNNDHVNYILLYTIAKTKNAGISNELTKCFTNGLNVINDKVLQLRFVLNDLYKAVPNSVKNHFDKVYTIEQFIGQFLTDEQIKEAEKRYEANRIATNKQKEEENKEKIKQTKERKEQQKQAQKNKKSTVNVKIKDNSIESEIRRKLFTSSMTLRKDVIDKYTINDLIGRLEILQEKNIITNIEQYITEYNNLVCEKRTNRVIRILDKKDLHKYKMIALNDQIKTFITNDDFDNKSDKEIKEGIISIIQKIINPENNINITNHIVFSEEDLLDNEFIKINNSSVGNKEAIISNIYTQLNKLQNEYLGTIKSNVPDSFHTIKYGNQYGQDLELDGKLKLYRFGPKKTKIGFTILSVHPNNQAKLNEMYKTDNKSNVVLVFGVGSIDYEPELDIYDRFAKYALRNKDTLVYIYDIFNNEFTNETFKVACDLIDNGIVNIKNENNKTKTFTN